MDMELQWIPYFLKKVFEIDNGAVDLKWRGKLRSDKAREAAQRAMEQHWNDWRFAADWEKQKGIKQKRRGKAVWGREREREGTRSGRRPEIPHNKTAVIRWREQLWTENQQQQLPFMFDSIHKASIFYSIPPVQRANNASLKVVLTKKNKNLQDKWQKF